MKPFGLEVPLRNESAIIKKKQQDNTSLAHRAKFLQIHAVLMREMIQEVCDRHPLHHVSDHTVAKLCLISYVLRYHSNLTREI